MEEVILSIVILTRNRKMEVVNSISSCIECYLPTQMEFIIIDNASEDGTRKAIELLFKDTRYNYNYYYQKTNLGVATGRNVGFSHANGRYVFFLDDDAYINFPKQFFFQKMIEYLEDNEDRFCVTTSVFDTALNNERLLISQNICKIQRFLCFKADQFW